MKRPIPVILSAVLLGLLAALELLAALGMAVVGFLALRRAFPTPTPSPFSPSFLPILFFGMSLFALALAVWSILTLIGLVRLRGWARYSVLVIGGCMAAFGAIGVVTCFAMPFFMSAAATQPGVDLSHLRIVFFLCGAVYAVMTAIGIAWLVYFNLADTRALFLQDAPLHFDPPNTSTGRPRPTAITVISWIYLVSAPFCLLYLFFPFPAFLVGFVFYGLSAHLIYGAIGVLTFTIGYGLLRLRNEARLAVYALSALCPMQLIVLLTPWGSRQFRIYMDAFGAHMYASQPPPPNFTTSPGAPIFFSILGIAGCGVVVWFLHRHREAFTPAPLPPPQMPAAEALAG